MADPHREVPRMPAFEAFYQAVNGRSPFPWQARLARQVSRDGAWPVEIGVPTGLGKTACLDIAVWWLASQAHLPPRERPAPTRIWWVVNRRLLVDEASKHAERMNKMLREPGADGRSHHAEDVLSRIAARLRSIGGPQTSEPLYVIPMRGGLTLRRPPNPAQPSVIVSTIPMYGSRLLFRGFGSSRSMRPIDAALAGTDSLVLVDEAHLARHLRELMPKLKQCAPESASALLPARRDAPQVVSLTATGDASLDSRFELDDDDLADATICQRLDADKPVEVDAEPRGDSAKALRDAAVRMLSTARSPASCVIFCNTPAAARQVYGLVESHGLGSKADLMLVTGRIRQADADILRARLLSPTEGVPATSESLPQRERHLIVIATQTLEVGADLDFEYLVTEQCGVRALTQRLGRLNRLGRHEHARAVYVHRPPPKRSRSSLARDDDSISPDGGWPVYGDEPGRVLERFNQQGLDDAINLSPRTIAGILGEPSDDPGRAPEVLPDLLWEWIKTTTPPHGEAPVEPYFCGIEQPQRAVSVMWRIFVPNTADYSGDMADDELDEFETADVRVPLWPRARSDETVEIPDYELREALGANEIEFVNRLSPDENIVEPARLRELRPGDLVVLPTDAGMYDEFGWAPDSKEPVSDLSIERSGLPLDTKALERLCRDKSSGLTSELSNAVKAVLRDEEEEPDDALSREAAEHLLALLRDHAAIGFDPDEWHAFLDSLDPAPVRSPRIAPRIETRDAAPSAAMDESDEVSLCASLPPQAMELVAHGDAVGKRACETAAALGLPEPIAKAIRDSGQLHDIGKVDSRFQRSLNGGSPVDDATDVPLAKSKMAKSRWPAAQRDAGWPRGARHEELSARLVRAWLATGNHTLTPGQQDLLVHLVVSHHGKGRPLVMPVGDGSAEPVEWRFADGEHPVRASADLSETDWGQPARFRRLNEQYGPWGLALLEAVVRQADHEVSAATEVQ